MSASKPDPDVLIAEHSGIDPTTLSILIVDDTAENLRLLFHLLSRRGYKVRAVNNGFQALESVQAKPPDLILMDIMMPEMDGYQTCARLKENPQTREIPVIFLSALDSVEDKINAFGAGGVDYITKPFQTEEVLARITIHLSLRVMQRQLELQNARLEQEIADRRAAEAALRESEAALRRYTAELETSNAELDAFAHTVAHDLKNPLTSMIGFVYLLQNRKERMSPEQTERALAMISQNSRKMTEIIDELLLLSSVRKVAEVETSPLEMASIVSEVQQRLELLLTEKGGTLMLPSSWPTVLGHRLWVEEVWVNYLSNALKYGGRPEAGEAPIVELGWDGPITEEGGRWIRFWIRDNGAGLMPNQSARLFSEFTRLEPSRVDGHGLGLSIVKRIVEKLGGRVGVESVPGQGSSFWFTLPAV